MFKSNAIVLAAVIGLAASASQAATVYASAATGTKNGVDTTCASAVRSTDRTDLCNALGAEDVSGTYKDGGYLSTANFDSIEFFFGSLIKGPVTIWEITRNQSLTYIESLSFLLIGTNGAADVVGHITNTTDGLADPLAPHRWVVTAADGATGPYIGLRVSDASNLYDVRDGFDIDAVSAQTFDPDVRAVPLPAGLLLMLSAVAGLGALRRKTV